MTKIIILGCSLAGIKIAEEIRQKGFSGEIIILTLEENLPYFRGMFADFIAHQISRQHLHYHPAAYYQKLQIQCLMDKKASRINFKRNRVYTGDGGSLAYDILILTDTDAAAYPAIKGTGKSGVYALRRLADVQDFMKNLPMFDNIVMESESLQGLKLTSALHKLGKEVVWPFSGKHLFSSWLDEESAAVIQIILEDAGIRLVEENTIAEILGDGEAKAVRLKSGKVLGAQAVIFTDLLPDLKIFKDTDLRFEENILVDNEFRTNISNVFAVDRICSSGNWEDLPDDRFLLEQQALIVAKCLAGQVPSEGTAAETKPFIQLGETKNFQCPMTTVQIKDSVVHFIGKICRQDDVDMQSQYNSDSKGYKKIFIRGDHVIGAILVNWEMEKQEIINFIEQQVPIKALEAMGSVHSLQESLD